MPVRLSVLLFALVLPLGLAAPAPAHDAPGHHHHHDAIVVEQPWARATAPGAGAGAAYMVVSTAGEQPDRLVAARTPVAEQAELHTHLMEDGVMRMREVVAIQVDPGAPAVLAPGGLHVMLTGLLTPLVEGRSFPLTLVFETAGEVTVEVQVRSIMADGPAPASPSQAAPMN